MMPGPGGSVQKKSKGQVAMCGRFTLRAPASVIAEQFSLFELASWLQRLVSLGPWARKAQQSSPITTQDSKENKHVRHVDAVFQQIFVGQNFKR
jgi:hypothetical protein